ncbi:hypothetical protein SAMN05421736_101988 [Evansella caseinilytica]|uniref:Uncharacterized protein n=1 Tax=Evansella caseinilytica TaxID=1503961 RepID=A0A1H3J0L7_9BACI|nr:hypothetical protein [Evansella caseinilytica]SDY33553.1 hypothetical protein SAMN05421736_101988 [Evansella caseinilytica]
MSVLLPCFLGKKVYQDSTNERYYVVKYEEPFGKTKKLALLFDQDNPVIFAVLNKDGDFLDSFFLSKKTTAASKNAMERYKKIADRKKQYRVTQDDLRDALKTPDEAKMKNENIMKHLVDEHLEDIKQLWPSRLLTLQKTDGKTNRSLILAALEEALELANGAKALQFLVRHRFDNYVPNLSIHFPAHPQLLEDVKKYYLTDNQVAIVQQFLLHAARTTPLDRHDLVELLLSTANKIDQIHYSKILRQLLSHLFKRAKDEVNQSPKDWLNHTIHDKKLKQSIALSLKKKTG